MNLDKLVVIELDKTRHLRLTLKGMVEFEKFTGKSLLKGFDFGALSLEGTAALLWACLIHEQEDLTLNDVLNMVDLKNIAPVINALTACINQSLSEAKSTKRPLTKTSQSG